MRGFTFRSFSISVPYRERGGGLAFEKDLKFNHNDTNGNEKTSQFQNKFVRIIVMHDITCLLIEDMQMKITSCICNFCSHSYLLLINKYSV